MKHTLTSTFFLLGVTALYSDIFAQTADKCTSQNANAGRLQYESSCQQQRRTDPNQNKKNCIVSSIHSIEMTYLNNQVQITIPADVSWTISALPADINLVTSKGETVQPNMSYSGSVFVHTKPQNNTQAIQPQKVEFQLSNNSQNQSYIAKDEVCIYRPDKQFSITFPSSTNTQTGQAKTDTGADGFAFIESTNPISTDWYLPNSQSGRASRNRFFSHKDVTVSANQPWIARIHYADPAAQQPWVLFSTTNDTCVFPCKNETNTNKSVNFSLIMPGEFNYAPEKDRQAELIFYVMDNTGKFAEKQKFTIRQPAIDLTIPSPSPTTKGGVEFGKHYSLGSSQTRPSASSPDTIFLPYYAIDDGEIEITPTPTQITWDVLNHLSLESQFQFTLDPGCSTEASPMPSVCGRKAIFPHSNGGAMPVQQANHYPGVKSLQIKSKANFSRFPKVAPLVLYHANGSVLREPHSWRNWVIVQRAGYIEPKQPQLVLTHPRKTTTPTPLVLVSNLKEFKAQLVTDTNQTNSAAPDWITPLTTTEFTGVRGQEKEHSIDISTSKDNYSGADRVAYLVLTDSQAPAGRGVRKVVPIVQKHAYIRIVSPQAVILPNKFGPAVEVVVESNIAWRVGAPPQNNAWLVTHQTQAQQHTFTVSARENTESTERVSPLVFRPRDTNLYLTPDQSFSPNLTTVYPNYVRQIDKPIGLEVQPFPRLVFTSAKEQTQTMLIRTLGGWWIEILDAQTQNWLKTPEILTGVGTSRLLWSTLFENNSGKNRAVRLRVHAQVKSIPPVDVEILQTTDSYISMNTLVKDYLRVTFSAFTPGLRALIYNEIGVLNRTIQFSQSQQYVDLGTLPPGNYFVYFYDGHGEVLAVKKMIRL